MFRPQERREELGDWRGASEQGGAREREVGRGLEGRCDQECKRKC